jgi:hypothetical protein
MEVEWVRPRHRRLINADLCDSGHSQCRFERSGRRLCAKSEDIRVR